MDEPDRIDIEVKLAFHEKSLKELSAVIYRQQKQIDALEKTLKLVKESFKNRGASDSFPEAPLDEKPPHY